MQELSNLASNLAEMFPPRVMPLEWLKPYSMPITGFETREARSLSGLLYRATDTRKGIKIFCGVEKVGEADTWDAAIALTERDHATRILRVLTTS